MPGPQWFAVHNTATGELVSVGTVLASPLPANLTALPLAAEPDFAVQRWNPATKALDAYTPPPPPDAPSVQIMAQPEIVALTALQKIQIRLAVKRVVI